MKNEDLKRLILNGLSRVLESGINTPEKVVYLLVEINKVRELANDKTKDKIKKKTQKEKQKEEQLLNFYRDWVVHIKLDRNGTIIKVLDELENCIKKGANGKSIARSFIQNKPEFFTLVTLRKELGIFLSENELPCNLTKESKRWKLFVDIVLEVVKEGTIEPKESKESKKRIKKLSLVTDKKGNHSFKFKLNNMAEALMIKLKWK